MNKRPFIFLLSVMLAAGCLVGFGVIYKLSGRDFVPQQPPPTVREAEILRVTREMSPPVVERESESVAEQEEPATTVAETAVAGEVTLPPVLPGLIENGS
ncbi:MAG: hypothetical protein KGZ93_08425 [Actinobacteria bacterium]|nr:hypothetical protein [Actinomycetota bacterium]